MIKEGDLVKILDEAATGLVKKILSPELALVLVDGFPYSISISKLIPLSGKSDHAADTIPGATIHPKIKGVLEEVETSEPLKKITIGKGRKRESITQIDLHGHEIFDESKTINRSKILYYQIAYFLNALDKAIARKEKTIIFIHGKGEGILKAEIRKILHARGLEFFDAPLKLFGGGATQVMLR